jgi:hypothetical protein
MAVFECDTEPVFGPARQVLVDGYTRTVRQTLRAGVPGQRWELSPTQEFQTLSARLKGLRPWDWLKPDRGTPEFEASELVKRFPQFGPKVLRLLAIQLPEAPTGRFDLGEISASQGVGLLGVDPRTLLRKHLAGDLGEHGFLDEPLDDDQVFAPCLSDAGVQSRVAFQRGHGVIMSSYPVGAEIQSPRIRIASLISPVRCSTVVYSTRDLER